MSDPITARINRGAYDLPFSGVGMEFDALHTPPGLSGITLHETGFLTANRDWNFPGVFSPFWRFYHNFDRGHCVLFGERAFEIRPGELMLIPPNSLFHCLGLNPVASLWMAFSFVQRPHPDQAVPILLRARDTDDCLIRDLSALARDHPDPCHNGPVFRLSMALLQVTLARPELKWQPPLPETLAKVVDQIERYPERHYTIAELARFAGMSQPSFHRAFRAFMGTSPQRFIARVRIREAARLLAHTGLSIESIADRTGFPNRAYFSRVFKQLTGNPPARFRKEHSED